MELHEIINTPTIEQLRNVSREDMKQYILFILWHQLGAVTGLDKNIKWDDNWVGARFDTHAYNEFDVFRHLKTDKHDISILMFRFIKKYDMDNSIGQYFNPLIYNNYKEMIRGVLAYESLYKFVPKKVTKFIDKFKDFNFNESEIPIMDKSIAESFEIRSGFAKSWYKSYVYVSNRDSETMSRVSLLEQKCGRLITDAFENAYNITRELISERDKFALKRKCDSVCANILKTAFVDSSIHSTMYPTPYKFRLKVCIDWNAVDFTTMQNDEFITQHKIAVKRYYLREYLESTRMDLQHDSCVVRGNCRVINDTDIEVVFNAKKLQEEFPGESTAQWIKHRIRYPHHIIDITIDEGEFTAVVRMD